MESPRTKDYTCIPGVDALSFIFVDAPGQRWLQESFSRFARIIECNWNVIRSGRNFSFGRGIAGISTMSGDRNGTRVRIENTVGFRIEGTSIENY